MKRDSIQRAAALWLAVVAGACGGACLGAQPRGINQDEAQVPPYVLPEVLRMANGTTVTSKTDWETQRRPEILHLFETQVYGSSPGKPAGMRFIVTTTETNALGGLAIRKEVTLQLAPAPEAPRLNLLLYIPQGRHPAPAFLVPNFHGNQTIHADPGITLREQWTRAEKNGPWTRGWPDASSRGKDASAWPVEEILQRGYALATVHYWDVEPDDPEGYAYGVRSFFPLTNSAPKAPDAWGAIATWAWGLSRAMDYLETDPDIASSRVVLMGHSRLGKTALWAGAQDKRFAIVIANESGEGGAALSRRWFGETVERINTSFPHWFCGNYKHYNNHEDQLPVDQHMLIALIAPRPVYIASAEEDRWSDPKGEFLVALNAEPVYQLYGLGGLGVTNLPPLEQPTGQFVGYHIRRGKHAVTRYDWDRYLDFADRHFASSGGNAK